jgi:hypothetical protein
MVKFLGNVMMAVFRVWLIGMALTLAISVSYAITRLFM